MTVFNRSHDLEGHRAFVSGAARGMGLGIARALGRWGAKVAIGDLSQEAVDAALAGLRGEGIEAIGVALDVTDEASVAAGLNHAWQEFGGLDLLVNNAGVLAVADLAAAELRDWEKTLDVNATGTFLMSRAMVRRLLQDERPGSVISLSSMAGKRGDPGMSAYSASKFAVIGMTQALAREVGHADILVNAICPGVVCTDMIDKLASESGQSPEEWIAQQAVPRAQTPADMAYAIGFLHLSRAITGQALNVDGGSVFH